MNHSLNNIVNNNSKEESRTHPQCYMASQWDISDQNHWRITVQMLNSIFQPLYLSSLERKTPGVWERKEEDDTAGEVYKSSSSNLVEIFLFLVFYY